MSDNTWMDLSGGLNGELYRFCAITSYSQDPMIRSELPLLLLLPHCACLFTSDAWLESTWHWNGLCWRDACIMIRPTGRGGEGRGRERTGGGVTWNESNLMFVAPHIIMDRTIRESSIAVAPPLWWSFIVSPLHTTNCCSFVNGRGREGCKWNWIQQSPTPLTHVQQSWAWSVTPSRSHEFICSLDLTSTLVSVHQNHNPVWFTQQVKGYASPFEMRLIRWRWVPIETTAEQPRAHPFCNHGGAIMTTPLSSPSSLLCHFMSFCLKPACPSRPNSLVPWSGQGGIYKKDAISNQTCPDRDLHLHHQIPFPVKDTYSCQPIWLFSLKMKVFTHTRN